MGPFRAEILLTPKLAPKVGPPGPPRVGSDPPPGPKTNLCVERLDELDYPKPNEDFLRATFAAFADAQPWVGDRPGQLCPATNV